MTITNTLTSDNDIILSERKTTTEYKIVDIYEDIKKRRVKVELAIGPFVTKTFPGLAQTIQVFPEGGTRSLVVWQGDEYDAIRDTWTNADLMAAVAALM
jgi:hypothetical protein